MESEGTAKGFFRCVCPSNTTGGVRHEVTQTRATGSWVDRYYAYRTILPNSSRKQVLRDLTGGKSAPQYQKIQKPSRRERQVCLALGPTSLEGHREVALKLRV